ncbi:MAG: hypothetical protein ACYDAQ_17215 [Mycobacteriales bacterium]
MTRELARTGTVRLTATLAFAGAAVLGVVAGWGQPGAWAVPALLAGVALSEIAVVHLAFGRQRWTFSCTDALLGAAFVLAPGAWVALAVAGGVAVAQLLRRQPRLKAAFNVSQFCFAATGAAAVDGLLRHTGTENAWTAAGVAMGCFWVINHVLVAFAVAVTSRRPLRELLFASAPLSLLHTSGNTSVGLLAAWLALRAPFGLFGLLVPAALLWSSYDQQTRRAAEARLFAELAEGQEKAFGRSVDASAQVVVVTTARLFGGADVELLVLGADGPVCYSGSELGTARRTVVEAGAFDQPWVLQALGSEGLVTGVDGGRPYLSALIGTRDVPLAVLIARRPTGTGGVSRGETMLADLLVRQAASWLSVADLTASRDAALTQVEAVGEAARALSDIGAHTTPALSRLRDSAGRLARLADSRGAEAAAVDDIVAELHSVERAVASLLGAIALAAETDLATATPTTTTATTTTATTTTATIAPCTNVLLPAARAAADWTSSGTLP